MPVQGDGLEDMSFVDETENAPEPPQEAVQTAAEPRTIRTKITGVTRGNRQAYLAGCHAGQRLMIKNHPLEKFPHAMAVYTLKRV